MNHDYLSHLLETINAVVVDACYLPVLGRSLGRSLIFDILRSIQQLWRMGAAWSALSDRNQPALVPESPRIGSHIRATKHHCGR